MLVNNVTLLWEGQRTKRGRWELKVTELAGTFLISRITYSRKYCKLPDWHQTFVCKLLEICLEFPVGRFLACLYWNFLLHHHTDSLQRSSSCLCLKKITTLVRFHIKWISSLYVYEIIFGLMIKKCKIFKLSHKTYTISNFSLSEYLIHLYLWCNFYVPRDKKLWFLAFGNKRFYKRSKVLAEKGCT